jgi:Tol biopolymer transport system component
MAVLCLCGYILAADTVGIFEGHSDVGINPKGGSIEFNSATSEYRVTGGGANVWAADDAYQFAWRRLSGDVNLTADIQFVGTGAVAHRKAMIMVRQDLTPESAYADVALHGDGLTSLQYRPTAGAQTQEIASTVKGPVRIRLQRRGNEFVMYAGKPGEQLTASAPATVVLKDPVYVGIGVCSHDANILETALFTNVQIAPAVQQAKPRVRYGSKITVYDLTTKSARVIYSADQLWEAPNWTPDGKYLIANTGGRIYRLDPNATGPVTPEKVDIDASYSCNNDHGPSWSGKLLAFSASSPEVRQSRVYISDADGRNVRLITPKSPSYFHGWSPDDKWLTFIAARGDQNYDVYRISAAGGEEERLTSSAGYDDGSEYSPDGKWIYFNSDRADKAWDVWRIPADGAGPNDSRAERVTNDEQEDWFPHVSPDGKLIVFLSFPPGIKDHNGRMDIQLRMMPAPGARIQPAKIETLTKIFGGQGTINVNSWSPDSKKFAYVVYELLP